MRWLVRLVTPPDGLIIDPFVGSGTTGMAAALEGRSFLGIDQDADYVRIAEARIVSVQEAAA
jgi:site-specific DNA-methyltransferase (adenine-specific)